MGKKRRNLQKAKAIRAKTAKGTTQPLEYATIKEWQDSRPKETRRQKAARHAQNKAQYLHRLSQRLGYKNYDDYTSSQEWEYTKTIVSRFWDDLRCLACGHPKTVFHHITYKNLGKEKAGDLIPLCRRCHKDLHKTNRRYNIPIKDFMRGLTLMFQWDEEQQKAVQARYNAVVNKPAEEVEHEFQMLKSPPNLT